jgi:anthranilate phosphoribosyltransferase
MSSSPSSLTEALSRLVQMEDLPLELAERVFGELMDGTAGEVPTAALLTALRMKGEAVTEIAGAARAMFARATRVPVQRRGLLDTCGTGGDELQTFNISTAAAIVVAACGVPVAKHGNRSVSSRSGSADSPRG